MQFLPQLKCVQETHEVLMKWLLHWCTNTKDAPRCGHVAPSWVYSLLSLGLSCHCGMGSPLSAYCRQCQKVVLITGCPTHKGRGSGYASPISWASGSAEAL